MIKVDQALSTILENIKIMDSQTVSLVDALARVVAEDVFAGFDIPGEDNSAMDGYALRAKDVIGASQHDPRTLEVIEVLKAGTLSSKSLKKNQAIKIMTGAAMPQGADSVIMVEDTEEVSSVKGQVSSKKKELVKILKTVKPNENIRKAGEDIKKGELVIAKGTLLKPAGIGILASLGKSKIKVFKKPKVAVLATGNEIIDVKDEFQQGKLYSSNTYTLYSQIIKSGGVPKNLGIVSDETKELKERINQGLDCDLIITSGGVSMGDYDLVKAVLENMGAQIKFWKVAIKPGKPLLFGALKGIPVFGLPGNPVSSMVTFEIFVKPAIFKSLGRNLNYHEGFEATVEEDLKKKKGLRYFLRAKTVWKEGNYHTVTTGPQGSGILKSMILANSLIVLPEDVEYIPRGSKVKVKFLH